MQSLNLPTGGTAQYTWSTLFLELNVLDAPSLRWVFKNNLHKDENVPKDLESSVVTSLGRVGAPSPWDSTYEAVADICLRHELAHFAQDVGTGIGFWDEFQLRSNTLTVLGAWSSKQDWGGLEQSRTQWVDDIFEKTIMLRSPAQEDAAAARRLEFLITNGVLDKSADRALLLDRCATRSILEADAAAQVLVHVLGMLDSDANRPHHEEIRRSVAQLWSPGHMSEEYAGWIREFYSLFPDENGGRASVLRILMRIFRFVVDIALAHPPPEMVERIGRGEPWFDPSVKMSFLIAALGKLNGPEGKLLAGFDDDLDTIEKAERALLDHCPFKYPTRRQIYEAWANTLDTVENDSGSVHLRWRRAACKARLAAPIASHDMSMFGSIFSFIDIWTKSPNEPPKPWKISDVVWLREETKNGDAMLRVATDLLLRLTDLSMIEYLHKKSPFRCPFGLSKGCKAATDKCLSGLSSELEFPPLPGCGIRHRYSQVNL
jgi:hypothetical protein